MELYFTHSEFHAFRWAVPWVLQSCNHHHSEDTERFHHLKNSPRPYSSWLPPSFPKVLENTDLSLFYFFQNVNGTIQHEAFWVWILWLSIWSSWSIWDSPVWLCAWAVCFYRWGVLHCTNGLQLTLQPVEAHVGISQSLLIMNKTTYKHPWTGVVWRSVFLSLG